MFESAINYIFTHWGPVASILGPVWQKHLTKRGQLSEDRKQYELLRREIATALTMYAQYLSNPLFLDSNGQYKNSLSQYQEASQVFRKLASQLKALSETLSEKSKDLPISRQDMCDVSRYLIGLSNSFTTPDYPGASENNRKAKQDWEHKVRILLSISNNEGD